MGVRQQADRSGGEDQQEADHGVWAPGKQVRGEVGGVWTEARWDGGVGERGEGVCEAEDVD